MSRLSEIDFKDGKASVSKEIADYYLACGYDGMRIPLNAELCNYIAKVIGILNEQGPEKIKKETEIFHSVEMRTVNEGVQVIIDGDTIGRIVEIGELKRDKNSIVLWYSQISNGKNGKFIIKDNELVSEIHFVKTDKIVFKHAEKTSISYPNDGTPLTWINKGFPPFSEMW